MPGQRRTKALETRQREFAVVLGNLLDQKPTAAKEKPRRLRAWAFRCRWALWVVAATAVTLLLGVIVDIADVPTLTALLLGVPVLAAVVWWSWDFTDADRRWTVLPTVLAVAYVVATAGGM